MTPRRDLDTNKPGRPTQHGSTLPAFKKSVDQANDAIWRRGRSRSSHAGTDRRPKGGQP